MSVCLAFMTTISSFLRSSSHINLRASLPNSIKSSSEDFAWNDRELTESPGRTGHVEYYWQYWVILTTIFYPQRKAASLPHSPGCGLNKKMSSWAHVLESRYLVGGAVLASSENLRRDLAGGRWPLERGPGRCVILDSLLSPLLPAKEQWRSLATHILLIQRFCSRRVAMQSGVLATVTQK